MSKHFPPLYEKSRFHCPYCGVYSVQEWYDARMSSRDRGGSEVYEDGTMSKCAHCYQIAVWINGKMILPDSGGAPPAHADMPAEIIPDYNEAASVVSRSPRAAAAILRLCLQKLMPLIGQRGGNINADIAALVKDGMHPMVQRACDAVRVIGNNAVHPGELNLNDTPDVAHSLFELVNVIVEEQIARPKKVSEIFGRLPQGAKDAIAKRDGTSGQP